MIVANVRFMCYNKLLMNNIVWILPEYTQDSRAKQYNYILHKTTLNENKITEESIDHAYNSIFSIAFRARRIHRYS